MNLHIKENLKISYDKNAKLRDKSEIESWKLKELDHFLSHLNSRKQTKVLDVGAGSGQFGWYIKEKGLDVTCIDISPNMVETCIKKGLNALEMDFYNLSFEDNYFDGIWAMNSLLHIPKQDLLNVLKEVRRVMKPDGTFYMGVYGGYESEGIWEDDPYQPQRYFSFYDEIMLKEKITQLFELKEFRTIPLDGMKLDFQGMVIRKG